jgi:hypothetical protein
MKKSFIAFASVFFMFAACLDASGQKIDLVLNLQNGHTYYQDMVSTSNIDQKVGEMDLNIEMEIKGRMAFLVKEVRKEDYLMDVQYEKISLRMALPMTQEIIMDSESNDPENIFSRMMGGIVAKPFGVRMSRSGKVLEIIGIEKIFDAVFDQFSELPADQLQQIKSQLQEAYGEKSFRGSMEMLTAIYPEKPVAIGEKWNVQTNLMGMLDAKIDASFQLDQNTRDYRLITGNAQIKVNPESTVEMEKGALKMDLEGTMLSNIKVDPKTGWVIAANFNQNIQGESVIQPSDEMPDGMSIPMSLISKIEIKGK